MNSTTGRDEAAWAFEQDGIETPAFVYDEARIAVSTARVCHIASAAGCSVLYALKPFAFAEGLRLIAGQVAGFATSSIFESVLAREILGPRGSVHLASPGLRERDLAALEGLCDYVSFNSLSQWTRLRPLVSDATTCGLRVNPQLSFVEDPRYDPCRAGSKLGVPLDALVRACKTNPKLISALDGLHFHSNCDCVLIVTGGAYNMSGLMHIPRHVVSHTLEQDVDTCLRMSTF